MARRKLQWTLVLASAVALTLTVLWLGTRDSAHTPRREHPRIDARVRRSGQTGWVGNWLVRDSNNPLQPGVEVEFWQSSITDDDVRYLRDHIQEAGPVVSLKLSGTYATDSQLAQIAEVPEIHTLSLVATEVSDEGMRHVGRLPNLEALWLTATKVGDAGMDHLTSLQNLRALFLGGSRVSDAGLHHLKAHKHLRLLYLSDLGITDAGLAGLRELTELEDLNLQYAYYRSGAGKRSRIAPPARAQHLPLRHH